MKPEVIYSPELKFFKDYLERFVINILLYLVIITACDLFYTFLISSLGSTLPPKPSPKPSEEKMDVDPPKTPPSASKEPAKVIIIHKHHNYVI